MYVVRWAVAIVLVLTATALAPVAPTTVAPRPLLNALRLTWQSVSTPVGGSRDTTADTIWMQAKANGSVSKLISRTTDGGKTAEMTLWPFGQHSQLAMIESGSCHLTVPPTASNVAAIVSDTVGPIPLPSSSAYGFTHLNGRWESLQGAITVVIVQKGPLSSRVVDMYLNTRDKSAHPLVEQLTHISFDHAQLPTSLELRAREICGMHHR